MSAIRLHSLTAVCLAALYGVVGFTGTSLHYFATHAWGTWAESRRVDVGGYTHIHAPGHHRHFHRHEPLSGHQHAAVRNNHKRSAARHGVVEPSRDSQHSHATPLLTLVCKLKLSQTASHGTPMILDSIIASDCNCEHIPKLEKPRIFCPRGPPGCGIA